MKHSIISTAGN